MAQKTTTTDTPSYSANQTQVQGMLSDYLQKGMTGDGSAALAPMKAQAVGQVNQNASSLQDRLNSNFSSRGFGGSGKANLDTQKLEMGRQSNLAGVEGQFAGMQLDQQNKTANLAENYGFMNPTRTQVKTESPNYMGALTSIASMAMTIGTGGMGGGGGAGGGMFSKLFGGGGMSTPSGGDDYQNYA